MQKPWLLILSSFALFGVLILLLAAPDSRSRSNNANDRANDNDDSEGLVVYCAASNRAVMEAIQADYEKECGRTLQIQYGGSQTLLSGIEVNPSGDIYLPADDSYITLGRDKGLLAESIPVAKMQGVVAIPKGNPKRIESFEDLLRDDIRLVQASPDATAIGKVVRNILSKQDKWDTLSQATISFRTTVNEVANDIKVGAADAGIVYDAVLHTYPDVEFIELPELEPVYSTITISILKDSQNPTAALHFARYLSARDRGLLQYQKFGFRPVNGDEWKETPELSLFAGSMLRPAIDQTVTDFEKREGIRVNRVYNGCGILVAQMKSGQMPDAYFACDSEFMNQVSDQFPKPTDVSQNELVILVQKGNPHNIRTLRDLAKPGIKVGVGHEKQCAMGWLTQNTFKEGGVQEEVMENVTVQSPTGDLLVNKMKAKSLDAAVAYLSNAAGSGDTLDAIRIHGLKCSVATQPYAIALDSPHQHLAKRLLDRIQTEESKETFQAEGFRWQNATD